MPRPRETNSDVFFCCSDGLDPRSANMQGKPTVCAQTSMQDERCSIPQVVIPDFQILHAPLLAATFEVPGLFGPSCVWRQALWTSCGVLRPCLVPSAWQGLLRSILTKEASSQQDGSHRINGATLSIARFQFLASGNVLLHAVGMHRLQTPHMIQWAVEKGEPSDAVLPT